MRRLRSPRVIGVLAMVCLTGLVTANCHGSTRSAPEPAAGRPPATQLWTPAPTPQVLQGVVIEDSVAAESPYGGLGSRAWTAALQRQLGLAGVDMYLRVGLAPGYTEEDGKSFATEIRLRVNPDTDVVILFGGTSDIPSLDTLRVAVDATLHDIAAIAPAAEVIIIGPIWTRPDPAPEPLVAVGNVLRDAAAADNGQFIDPIGENWFAGRDDAVTGDDSPALSDAAHQIIADRLTDRVAAAARSAAGRTQAPS